jgi:hypothetical protein
MIKFALRCERGHEFESWFPDGADYESQARRGLVLCPDCDSKRVRKAPMAPALLGGRRGERAAPAAPTPTDEPAPTAPVALLDEKQRELRAALGALRRMIESNTVDVGPKFPEVARAIHAGDEPERAVRGRATAAEARALLEEGIGVLPLPTLPDEAN